MRKRKMNGLYKTAFILLIICILLFAAALITAYAFDKKYLSTVFSGGGVFLAFLGIIFACFSKPKKEKKEYTEKEKEISE